MNGLLKYANPSQKATTLATPQAIHKYPIKNQIPYTKSTYKNALGANIPEHYFQSLKVIAITLSIIFAFLLLINAIGNPHPLENINTALVALVAALVIRHA